MDDKHAGLLCVLLASVMWALEPVFAKLSYKNSNFFQTSLIRAIFAFIIALIYAGWKKANFRLDKKQAPVLIYIAIAGTVFADLMYFFALTQVPVINAVLIGHMQPLFVILIGFVLLKGEKLTKIDYTGISFMMLSGLMVTTKTFSNLSSLKIGTFGDLLVLFATISWATTAIIMRKYLKKMNAGIITFYRFLFASIIFISYEILKSSIRIANIYQPLIGIIVGTGTILYYEGLKRLKAAQVSALELSTPFFASLLAFFILDEKITLMQTAGIFLLCIGIYFLSKRE